MTPGQRRSCNLQSSLDLLPQLDMASWLLSRRKAPLPRDPTVRRTIQLAALIVALAAIPFPSPPQAQPTRAVARAAASSAASSYHPSLFDPFPAPYGSVPYP